MDRKAVDSEVWWQRSRDLETGEQQLGLGCARRMAWMAAWNAWWRSAWRCGSAAWEARRWTCGLERQRAAPGDSATRRVGAYRVECRSCSTSGANARSRVVSRGPASAVAGTTERSRLCRRVVRHAPLSRRMDLLAPSRCCLSHRSGSDVGANHAPVTPAARRGCRVKGGVCPCRSMECRRGPELH